MNLPKRVNFSSWQAWATMSRSIACLSGICRPSGLPYAVASHRELTPDSLPLAGASLFVFETSSTIETLVRLEREGGILIPCDSLHNWETADAYFNERAIKGFADFIVRANVGPGWLKASAPQPSDFKRLLELSFQHLLPAHGTPLLNDAHSAFAATFKRLFDLDS